MQHPAAPPVVAVNLTFVSQQGPARADRPGTFLASDYCKDVQHAFEEMVREFEAQIIYIKSLEEQWEQYRSALLELARKLNEELFSSPRNYMAEKMTMPAYIEDENDVAAVAQYLTEAARFLGIVFCAKGIGTRS